MRCSLLLWVAALALCAVASPAQIALQVNNTAYDQEYVAFRIDVDHGTLPSVVQVGVELSTASPNGLEIAIYDWDSYVSGNPMVDTDRIEGPGTVQAHVSTGLRTGVHPFLLTVSSRDYVGASQFNGTVVVSGQSAALVTAGRHKVEEHGAYNVLCELFADLTNLDARGRTRYTLTIDAGETPQTFYVRYEAQATRVSLLRLLDNQGSTIEKVDAEEDAIDAVGIHPISGKGIMKISLETDHGKPGARFLARIALPSSVNILEVKVRTETDSKEVEYGCSVSNSGAPTAIVALALLLGALRRRKAGSILS
jgi:MYXO-CTERM domain-containing protein